jgi:hypothetical protein
MQLGRISINIILKELAPKSFAAKTYWRFFSTMTCARMMRIKFGTATTETAMMALVIPGPKTATITMANKILGRDMMRSVNRMMIRSVNPP